MPPASELAPIRSMRLLTFALMAALVVIGIAITFVLKSPNRNGVTPVTHTPGIWMYGAILGYGVIIALVIATVGYRLPAISPSVDPAAARNQAVLLFRQTMILRFALSESIAIITIALIFAFKSNTILPYVLAAAIALVLMAYHVWPSERLISRVQEKLDRDGGRSDLLNALNGTSKF